MPSVSVVTALYNRLDVTRPFVSSLLAFPPGDDWEVIFVDDGSTDGTRDFLRTLDPARFKVVLNERNRGFAANNNLGARMARGQLLALLNNDLVLTEGWWRPMEELLLRDARVGVVGNIQLRPSTGRIDHAGIRWDALGRPMHRLGSVLLWQALPWIRQTAATAACCALRRETFLREGGLDEGFRNGYEDMDLCRRLGARGYRNYVATQSVVWHHVSASPGRFVAEDANLKLFLSRWGPAYSWRREGVAYLERYWNRPWRYNGPKLLRALRRVATNRE